MYLSQCHNVNTLFFSRQIFNQMTPMAPLAFCFSTEDERQRHSVSTCQSQGPHLFLKVAIIIPIQQLRKVVASMLYNWNPRRLSVPLARGCVSRVEIFFLILSIAIMSFMKCVQTHRYMYIVYWIHLALKLIGSRHTSAFINKHIAFYVCSVPFSYQTCFLYYLFFETLQIMSSEKISSKGWGKIVHNPIAAK